MTTMKIKRNLSISLTATVAVLAALTGFVRPANADLTGPKPPRRDVISMEKVLIDLVQMFTGTPDKHK